VPDCRSIATSCLDARSHHGRHCARPERGRGRRVRPTEGFAHAGRGHGSLGANRISRIPSLITASLTEHCRSQCNRSHAKVVTGPESRRSGWTGTGHDRRSQGRPSGWSRGADRRPADFREGRGSLPIFSSTLSQCRERPCATSISIQRGFIKRPPLPKYLASSVLDAMRPDPCYAGAPAARYPAQ